MSPKESSGRARRADGSRRARASGRARALAISVALSSAFAGGCAPAKPAAPPSALSVDAYARAFTAAFERTAGTKRSSSRAITTMPEPVPVHRVDAYERGGKLDSCTFVTNGIGRVAQPNTDRVRAPKFLEFVAYAERCDARVGLFLSLLGGAMLTGRKGDDPWGAYDTFALPEPLEGLQYFVFSPGGRLKAEAGGGGAEVTLLVVTPLTAPEYDEIVAGQTSREWLDGHTGSKALQAQMARRWNLMSRPADEP